MNKETLHQLIKDYIQNRISQEKYLELIHGFDQEYIEQEYEIVLRTMFDDILSNESKKETSSSEYRQQAKKIIRENKKKGVFTRIYVSYIYKLVASIAIFATLFLAYKYWLSDRGKIPLQYELSERNTLKGERAELTLTDGTFVKLNAGSKLTYPNSFQTNTREVNLSGEAYFDVERNERKSFIIHTNSLDISVLGTSFNVKAYEDNEYCSVTVESGKVRVTLKEDDYYDLLSGQELRLYYKSNKVNLFEVKSTVATSWTTGILYFDKTPFYEIELTLERWYDVNITIEDKSLKYKLLNGQHDNQTLQEVLASLSYLLDFEYEIKGKDVIIK